MLYNYSPASLEGKSVVISGGTTGIGRAAAIRLLREGAHVLIFGRHEPELQDALQDLNSVGRGKVVGLLADQAGEAGVKQVFSEAEAQLGGVDILIANAAVSAQSVVDTDYAEIAEVIDTNLTGVMAACKFAVEQMKTKGKGQIVVIGSMSAHEFTKGSDIYVATKSALQGFTESLRKGLVENDIRVILIEPGLVGTDMTASKVPVEEQPQKIEQAEMLRAEDLAEAIYFTLSQPERVSIAQMRVEPRKESR